MTFDATVGGPNATSYLSVAAADGYAAARVQGPATAKWDAADTQSKQRALQQATSEVDEYLRSSGIAHYSGSQALLYPRAVDVTGSTPYIPTAVMLATWAQARFLNANISVRDAAATRRARGMSSASEPTTSYTQDESASLLCDEAKGYLQGAFGGAATIRSVVIGTDYSYPRVGILATDLIP